MTATVRKPHIRTLCTHTCMLNSFIVFVFWVFLYATSIMSMTCLGMARMATHHYQWSKPVPVQPVAIHAQESVEHWDHLEDTQGSFLPLLPWEEHGLAAMHTWPNQAGTALHVSIVTGEVAPPPTRFGKGSPLLRPNQVKVPACSRQRDISLVRGKHGQRACQYGRYKGGGFLSYGVKFQVTAIWNKLYSVGLHSPAESHPLTSLGEYVSEPQPHLQGANACLPWVYWHGPYLLAGGIINSTRQELVAPIPTVSGLLEVVEGPRSVDVSVWVYKAKVCVSKI